MCSSKSPYRVVILGSLEQGVALRYLFALIKATFLGR